MFAQHHLPLQLHTHDLLPARRHEKDRALAARVRHQTIFSIVPRSIRPSCFEQSAFYNRDIPVPALSSLPWYLTKIQLPERLPFAQMLIQIDLCFMKSICEN